MAMGDRLAARRWLAGSLLPYLHHGIDVGDGTVVHARPDDPKRVFGGGRVVRTNIEDFAAGTPVRVVNDPPASFSPEETVCRALEHVGREGYCPVVDNCEHFATWCATGERASRQIDRIVAVGGRIAMLAAVTVASMAFRQSVGRTIPRT